MLLLGGLLTHGIHTKKKHKSDTQDLENNLSLPKPGENVAKDTLPKKMVLPKNPSWITHSQISFIQATVF